MRVGVDDVAPGGIIPDEAANETVTSGMGSLFEAV